MENMLVKLVNEYKTSDKNVSEISTEIMEIIERDYNIYQIADMLEQTGFVPTYMDTKTEDELYWACVDYIESELLNK